MKNTVPHYAKKGNPQPYTIYALAEQLERVTWKDVRYIGMSINPASRFQQHLSCSDTTNPGKNDWIRGILAHGKLPVWYKIEEAISTPELARQREQHWIRYAMSQGADLLNVSIVYTEQERAEIHAERAIRYANVAAILAQGTYVKRHDGGDWYPPRLLDRYSVPQKEHISLIDMIEIGFILQDDSFVSIADATNEQFDAFIRRYIPVHASNSNEWDLEERRDVIEYAMSWGKELELYYVPKPVKRGKKRK